MPNLRDIKRKIKSIKSTQKITGAMKMVSAAKLKKSQERMEAAKPYALKIKDLARNISKRVNPEAHPFIEKKKDVKSICVLAIASDRGLCGAFNSNVLKKTLQFIDMHKDKEIKVVCVGKSLYFALRRRKVNIIKEYITLLGHVTYDDAVTMGNHIMDQFLESNVDEIYIISNEFKSVIYHVPEVIKVLPVSKDVSNESYVDYLYEPSADILLNEIMPRYLNFIIYSKLLQSVAGEHGARMVAMDNATRNAGEMIDRFLLQYNKVRQSSITKEILDIVNGAEALR